MGGVVEHGDGAGLLILSVGGTVIIMSTESMAFEVAKTEECRVSTDW